MNSFIKFTILILLSIWLAGIFIEFLIPTFPALLKLYPFISLSFAKVCHQQPEKLITFSDYQTLTCARCTGLYVGSFAAGIIMILFSLNKKMNIKYLLITSGLLLTDVLLYSFGVYSYSKIFAFLTGLFFGSVVFNYFYFALSELNLSIKNSKEI